MGESLGEWLRETMARSKFRWDSYTFSKPDDSRVLFLNVRTTFRDPRSLKAVVSKVPCSFEKREEQQSRLELTRTPNSHLKVFDNTRSELGVADAHASLKSRTGGKPWRKHCESRNSRFVFDQWYDLALPFSWSAQEQSEIDAEELRRLNTGFDYNVRTNRRSYYNSGRPELDSRPTPVPGESNALYQMRLVWGHRI